MDLENFSTFGGRECGECSMCCKLMAISELKKPAGIWCQHVIKRKGCGIYDSRPPSCAVFECGYLRWPIAGDHWRPSKCKMVIVMEDESRMAVHVDPDTPNVWRIEPYYSDLMSWAREAFKHDQQLVVSIARRMFAFLPDGEVDLGYVAEDEIVFTGMRKDGTYLATKLKANDPRVQGIEYGKPVSAKLEL